MTEPLRTFEQAAEWLHVSDSWLRKQVAARKVPHTRLGRNVRFSEADLAEIVARARVEPTDVRRRIRGESH
jgi:excisionase family DNA binding protein